MADPNGGARAKTGTAPRRRSGALRLIGVLAIFGSLHALAMIGVELNRGWHASRAVAALEVDLAELEREAADLRAILEHADDLAYREQLARRQGFVHADEVRIVSAP